MTTTRTLALALALSFPALARSSAKTTNTDELVQCTDGSMGKAGKGACSHHGGVAKGADVSARQTTTTTTRVEKTAPAPAAAARDSLPPTERAPDNNAAKSKWSIFGNRSQGRTAGPLPRTAPGNAANTPPTARCKDGSFSHSAHHSGSCSHHGGVAEFLDAK